MGKSTVSFAMRAEVSSRGPNAHQPTTARMGTTVCSSWLAASAHVSRSSRWLRATWNTMKVTVMATTPISRKARNTVDDRFAFRASNNVVTPTIRLDWTVK